MHTETIRTLDKRWLLSFTSLPVGEIRVREFFRNLLDFINRLSPRTFETVEFIW
jgi:hypothetical protein